MKRIIIFLLRVFVLSMLTLFSFQKLTGKQLDGAEVRNEIDNAILRAKNNIKLIQSSGLWSQEKKVITTMNQINTGASISKDWIQVNNFSGIKSDIERNRDFFVNLQKSNTQFSSAVGRWQVFAKWIASVDKSQDALSVTTSGSESTYPAKYNADNAFAIQNWFLNSVFSNTGIQLLDGAGKYNIYYQASNMEWWKKWVILQLELWNSIVMDNLAPLLYYKNRFLFTIKEALWMKSLFVLNDNNEFETLWGWSLGGVGIDEDIVAFHDSDNNKLYFLSLDTLKIVKIIWLKQAGLTFQWFVRKGNDVWIMFVDNINKKVRYERWSW